MIQAHGTRVRRKRATRSAIKDRVSIHARSEVANERREMGHWDADLMAFLRNSLHMLVIHERVTSFTATLKLANKTAAQTLKCLIAFFQGLPKNLVKSITFDNEGEFARHIDLADLMGAKAYFCDTYAS